MLILITGYCATGKSTFASVLSRELRMPYFDKDTFKERSADVLGAINRLSDAAFELLKLTAERFLAVGQTVILESNFTPCEIAELNETIRRHNADALTFLFIGELHLLFERYQNRKRHWVHRSLTEREFADGQIALGQIEPLGKIVRVDATDFASVDFAALVATARRVYA